MPQPTRQPRITAAEIGEYHFCAKAWHLHRHGAQPDSAALDEGTRFHQHHGAQVAWSRRLLQAALACALLAALLLLWLLLTRTA